MLDPDYRERTFPVSSGAECRNSMLTGILRFRWALECEGERGPSSGELPILLIEVVEKSV